MLSILKSIARRSLPEGMYKDLHYVKERISGGHRSRGGPSVVQGNGRKYEYSLEGFEETGSVFIHIPRAAGSSVCHSLFGHSGGGHKTARGYRHKFGPWYRWYFVFTFVRNPFSRLVSAYDYLRKGGHPAWPSDRQFGEDVVGSYNGFSDFVLRWLTPDKSDFSKPHFSPQVHFLELDGELAVDFVGSVESIESDYTAVREKVGKTAPLERRNESPGERKPLARFYTEDAVIRRVRRVYRPDFERLGYYSPKVSDADAPPSIRTSQEEVGP